jgi:hypothetical protein
MSSKISLCNVCVFLFIETGECHLVYRDYASCSDIKEEGICTNTDFTKNLPNFSNNDKRDGCRWVGGMNEVD